MTFSSMSLIGLAAGSVFPDTVKVASSLLNNCSFIELDALDYYVIMSDQGGVELGRVSFEQATDEAQYLAHIMFQELMKFEFRDQNSGLSAKLGEGMKPNDKVLAMSDGIFSVRSIFDENRSYFTDNMVEYVSGLLQNSYSKQGDVTVSDRLLYNSWDMVKVNSRIHQAEKSQQYKRIIDKLYSIATHYCKGGLLTSFKSNGENWARQLMKHYSDNTVLDKLISDFNVQEYVGSGSSFEKAMWKVYNTINKVRALNVSSGSQIPDEEIQEFERILAGSVYSGFAMSMSWGGQNEQYTVLATTSATSSM